MGVPESHPPDPWTSGLHWPAMKRTYLRVMLSLIVQLALLWWLQQAFL
jgi:hypothetical protein